MWRAFTLLSQRAAGLRSMQELWGVYRERAPHLWGSATPAALVPAAEPADWTAVDFLTPGAPPRTRRQPRR
ncbi:Polyprenyl synthetase OS=Streptomyces glaucescens OX=1907 GN=SGLAU_17980 PE=3 SV=1 [Streptomyces glaucescens]